MIGIIFHLKASKVVIGILHSITIDSKKQTIRTQDLETASQGLETSYKIFFPFLDTITTYLISSTSFAIK